MNKLSQICMIGGDYSHWNSEELGTADFMIHKATEGTSFIDADLGNFKKIVKQQNMKCVGFYHYARPDVKGNTAFDEAEHFVKNIKEWIDKAIFILDWEGKSLKYSDSYAVNWLLKVEELTGVRPIIYTGSWATKKTALVAKFKYPLWLAHYEANTPKWWNYEDWSLWQFTSTPFDLSFSKWTEKEWIQHAKSSYDEEVVKILKEKFNN